MRVLDPSNANDQIVIQQFDNATYLKCGQNKSDYAEITIENFLYPVNPNLCNLKIDPETY